MNRNDRNSYLLRTYGITIKQYEELLEKQDHRCAICGRHESEFSRSLHVDHDHATGKVRGLLDYYCNRRVVGRNNEKTVRQLVTYILPEFSLILTKELDELKKVCNNRTRKVKK